MQLHFPGVRCRKSDWLGPGSLVQAGGGRQRIAGYIQCQGIWRGRGLGAGLNFLTAWRPLGLGALPARFLALGHRWLLSALEWGLVLTLVSLGGGVSGGLWPAGYLLPETV